MSVEQNKMITMNLRNTVTSWDVTWEQMKK